MNYLKRREFVFSYQDRHPSIKIIADALRAKRGRKGLKELSAELGCLRPSEVDRFLKGAEIEPHQIEAVKNWLFRNGYSKSSDTPWFYLTHLGVHQIGYAKNWLENWLKGDGKTLMCPHCGTEIPILMETCVNPYCQDWRDVSSWEEGTTWLEPYRDGFIEFTRNHDDPKYFEIVGIYTPKEAFSIHTYVDNNYNELLLHAQSLYDWVVDHSEQRYSLSDDRGSSSRFYYPESDYCISFTAIRIKCDVPWYLFSENFPEPLLIVYAPSPEAQAAGWLEAELLPEFSYFELVTDAVEDYFGINS